MSCQQKFLSEKIQTSQHRIVNQSIEKTLQDHQGQVSLKNNPDTILQIEQRKLTSSGLINTLEVHPIIKSQSQKRMRRRKGYWSLEQNTKYYLFLGSHLSHLQSTHLRRFEKIFKEMSNFIGTRTASQCRSHHQKLQKKYIELNILMQNLYQQIKQHPILLNSTAFQPLNFEDQVVLKHSDKQDHIENKSVKSNIEEVLIVYEMPEPLKIISHQQYLRITFEK